jgi:hypothetical protein
MPQINVKSMLREIITADMGVFWHIIYRLRRDRTGCKVLMSLPIMTDMFDR